MIAKPMFTSAVLLLAGVALAACGGQQTATRDNVRVVGSSTVLPFAKAVAESLAKSNAGIPAPIVESTGTGAGMKLFCAGVGAQHPDIENASRRMKKSEYEDCAKNGVKDVVEIQVGLDGIAFAEATGGPSFALTQAQIYKALAKNPFGKPQAAKLWSDVDPSLPREPILVYGPPSTSGTRDALKELILTKGCETDPAMKALKTSDEKKQKDICTKIREDGAYVEAGENDNLLVQKVAVDKDTLGVLGFSYLDENADKVKAVSLAGVSPSEETIANLSYPGSRKLYVYVKGEHLAVKPKIKDFVAAYAKMWGKNGLLEKRGLVPFAGADATAAAAQAAALTPLDAATVK